VARGLQGCGKAVGVVGHKGGVLDLFGEGF